MSKVRRYFGINKEEYLQIYEEQEGKCPICGVILDEHSADVDHSHIYNLVRGLLCRQCNLGLGLFKDDPQALKNAADYLERWEDIHSKEEIDLE